MSLAAATIAVVGIVAVLSLAAYVKIVYFGWHPLPSTVLGCGVHKRFHSSRVSTQVTSENLRLGTDCLKVTVVEPEQILRDVGKIAAIRGWLDARSDLWTTNFLMPFEDSPPMVRLRPCNATETYVVVDENSDHAMEKGRPQRPICRGEWRDLAAILARVEP